MVCWEVMLSKGQQWDWLGDPFPRVQTLLILFLLGLSGLIYRELRFFNPLVVIRTLAAGTSASAASSSFALTAFSTPTPSVFQPYCSLFGYDATTSGFFYHHQESLDDQCSSSSAPLSLAGSMPVT